MKFYNLGDKTFETDFRTYKCRPNLQPNSLSSVHTLKTHGCPCKLCEKHPRKTSHFGALSVGPVTLPVRRYLVPTPSTDGEGEG